MKFTRVLTVILSLLTLILITDDQTLERQYLKELLLTYISKF